MQEKSVDAKVKREKMTLLEKDGAAPHVGNNKHKVDQWAINSSESEDEGEEADSANISATGVQVGAVCFLCGACCQGPKVRQPYT